MSTDHEQLLELEPIMRRIGIWPDGLDYLAYMSHDPPIPAGWYLYGGLLDDQYVFAIVRDVAEKWLIEYGGLSAIHNWKERSFEEPEYEFDCKCVDGIVPALEYAESQM